MTRDQYSAIKRIYMRHFAEKGINYRTYRRDFVFVGDPCKQQYNYREWFAPYVGVRTTFGMYIGVEPDGYCHT